MVTRLAAAAAALALALGVAFAVAGVGFKFSPTFKFGTTHVTHSAFRFIPPQGKFKFRF